jgi:hypothetical protein
VKKNDGSHHLNIHVKPIPLVTIICLSYNGCCIFFFLQRAIGCGTSALNAMQLLKHVCDEGYPSICYGMLAGALLHNQDCLFQWYL